MSDDKYFIIIIIIVQIIIVWIEIFEWHRQYNRMKKILIYFYWPHVDFQFIFFLYFTFMQNERKWWWLFVVFFSHSGSSWSYKIRLIQNENFQFDSSFFLFKIKAKVFKYSNILLFNQFSFKKNWWPIQ